MAEEQNYFIIDFDSTFVQIEVMDELVKIVLRNSDNKEVSDEVDRITDQGMNGEIGFNQSLMRRVALILEISANKSHVKETTKLAEQRISASIDRNRGFFWVNRDNIYIISGGFKEVIVPIVKEFGIPAANVFANTFMYDTDGKIIGVDIANPLSKDGGKVEQVNCLKENGRLNGFVYAIGDGSTDHEIKEIGLADRFVAFMENVLRDKVVEKIVDKTDYVAMNFDKFLDREGLGVCSHSQRC